LVEAAIEKSAKEKLDNAQILAAINKAKKLDKDTPMHEQVLVTIFTDLVAAMDR
jgi:hypothetical protein